MYQVLFRENLRFKLIHIHGGGGGEKKKIYVFVHIHICKYWGDPRV